MHHHLTNNSNNNNNNTNTNNNSHQPPPSDPPNWRSGLGNGRFTVDSGGGPDSTTSYDPLSDTIGPNSLPTHFHPYPHGPPPFASVPSSPGHRLAIDFPFTSLSTARRPPPLPNQSPSPIEPLPHPSPNPPPDQRPIFSPLKPAPAPAAAANNNNNNSYSLIHHPPHNNNPSWHPPADNSSQPIRKLAEDAIYVSSAHPNDHRPAADWGTHHPHSDRSLWLLRDPSTTVLESPQSAPYSPFSPSSPYSSWSSLTAADDGSSTHEYRPAPNLPAHDPLAAQLWQLYGPRDERPPTNDALETLVRRLAELGLDVNELRQRLNSQEWKDPNLATYAQSGRPSSELGGKNSQNSEPADLSQEGSSSDKASRSRNTPQPSARLAKIDENLANPSLRSPLFTREPSLERGRKIEGGRRAACNLAGRWQEECTSLNRSPAVSDMDWKARSRSRSRPHADWRQGSRSRSRLQDLRPDFLAATHLLDADSSTCGQRLKPGPFEPPSSLFPESSDQSGPSSGLAANEAYHHGLIQQLIGSYQAQQSEENGLQSLAQKQADHLSFDALGPLASSSGLFQSSSTLLLGEFEFGSWHLPIKPSQHSLLGSIPGLTQDFADIANAHAEYGYIPRLVRKTSFDEILAQQHHPKRAPDSADRSPTRLDHLSCSTSESLVRPNTATDSREGQYRMGLDPSSGYEKAQSGSASQPDYFDLFSSTLSPRDPSSSEFKPDFQSPRLSAASSSDEPLFQARGAGPALPAFFATGESIVDRISPFDLLTQLDHFDSTPTARRDQWLQPSVAPAALLPPAAKAPEAPARLVSSPSSTSSSSAASSRPGPAAAAQSKMEKDIAAAAAEDGQAPATISFAGGRSCQPSSIAEARKRSKQMPYHAADPASAAASGPGSSGPPGTGGIQCLNCQTTETPLWRRDHEGRPLCNACGLFVNLHGTPRPAALSTGVIKRRNRGKNRDKPPAAAASKLPLPAAGTGTGTADRPGFLVRPRPFPPLPRPPAGNGADS
ncbi:hypothetical protein, variant [Puccinia triticina 1-1 BBBD Race 1]|uniref:GATA-type domain-containing protein n=1 Tax=Puccinia triticina (isolate 1-1 / race 1 (BBBD)) TaxID=630390 RepID=A0A180G446_PUCT1|nr:hypothetical protein, variant [Puccinia triticina 1-1 BBBD Race 1]